MSSNELTDDEIDFQTLRYGQTINDNVGYYWWKRYTYSAFWNIVSTPINLAITIFTALSTGQTATQSLTNQQIATTINIVTLILSVINTFFKPLEQLRINQSVKDKWSDIGVEYEEVYNTIVHSREQKLKKLEEMKKVFTRSTNTKKADESNYLIDLIFMFSRLFCIRKNIKWIPEASEEYKKEKLKLEALKKSKDEANQTMAESSV